MEKSNFIIIVTHIFDAEGRRLCTCGSEEPWETCSAPNGSDYCG